MKQIKAINFADVTDKDIQLIQEIRASAQYTDGVDSSISKGYIYNSFTHTRVFFSGLSGGKIFIDGDEGYAICFDNINTRFAIAPSLRQELEHETNFLLELDSLGKFAYIDQIAIRTRLNSASGAKGWTLLKHIESYYQQLSIRFIAGIIHFENFFSLSFFIKSKYRIIDFFEDSTGIRWYRLFREFQRESSIKNSASGGSFLGISLSQKMQLLKIADLYSSKSSKCVITWAGVIHNDNNLVKYMPASTFSSCQSIEKLILTSSKENNLIHSISGNIVSTIENICNMYSQRDHSGNSIFRLLDKKNFSFLIYPKHSSDKLAGSLREHLSMVLESDCISIPIISEHAVSAQFDTLASQTGITFIGNWEAWYKAYNSIFTLDGLVFPSQNYDLFHVITPYQWKDGDFAGGFVTFAIQKPISLDYQEIVARIHHFLAQCVIPLQLFHEREKKYYALRSAISSIMARNFSHNIGSHVLVRTAQESLSGQVTYGRYADDSTDRTNPFDPMKLVIDDAYKALDNVPPKTGDEPNGIDESIRHRVGAAIHYLEAVRDQLTIEGAGKSKQEAFAQDCKVLAAYVQARMDFVAAICTESLQWTASACLCHDVMAYFLKQSKILEHVVASEKLTAARFGSDGKMLPPPEEQGRIRFVMRYRESLGKPFEHVLNFNDEEGNIVNEKRRIPVAFPGGRTGWQAFYVIVAGILRNSAKHQYSEYIKQSAPDHPDYSLTEDKKCRDLEIVIDVTDNETIEYENNAERPAYTVHVYTNADIDKDKKTDRDEKSKKMSTWMCEQMEKPLIESTGAIVKTNWGLAEIRASVGYLQQAGSLQINENEYKSKEPLVSIVERSIKYEIPESTKPKSQYDEQNLFCYGFKLLKSQIIGIETTEPLCEDKTRSLEGWRFVRGNESRGFEYFVIDGRATKGTDIGKALVKMLLGETLDKSNKVGDFDSNEKIYGCLNLYPGRLFLVCAKDDCEKLATIFKTSPTYAPALLRIRVLNEKTSYSDLMKCYKGEKTASNQFYCPSNPNHTNPTECAALFLHEQWLKHWLNYRISQQQTGNNKADSNGKEQKTPENKTTPTLKLYHYLRSESNSSSSEEIYVPDTTPFKSSDKKEPDGQPILLLGTETTKTEEYPLVFGRHWGVFGNAELGFRTDERGKAEYQNHSILYGEAMNGNASYFSYAYESFKEYNGEKKDAPKTMLPLLSLAEAALMRVVIIDERVQENFAKANNLLGVAEQQVFVGYLKDAKANLYSQYAPGNAMENTGYVVVDFEDTKPTIKLKRKLETSGNGNTAELWKNPENGKCGCKFAPDILVIHQGIIDKWEEEDKTFDNETQKAIAEDKDNKRFGGDMKKAKIALFIEQLETKIPFVAITSGRGRPDSVPKDARFLSLSSIPIAPTGGCMYEKFPLVQQVLSIVNKKE